MECVLGLGTPYVAPVNNLLAIVKVSNGDTPVVPVCMEGWQRGSINDIETGEPIREFPQGFASVWISLTERKVYEYLADFSNEMIETANQMIEKGFKNRRGEDVTFTNFKASLFPNGMVRFHLLSSCKVQCLNSVFQGAETSAYNEVFLSQFGPNPVFRSIDEYCNIYYDSSDKDNLIEAAKFVNDEAIPANLWVRYYTRFDYNIRFSFEDPNSSLLFYAPKFSNSESYSCQWGVNNDVIIKHPSTLCSFKLWWRNSQFQYTSFFFFKEEEILPLFESKFADHPNQEAEFLVQIGKYNNSFEIDLCFGDEKFPLLQTEIRVYRDPISDLRGESELYYENYEGNCQNRFRGL